MTRSLVRTISVIAENINKAEGNIKTTGVYKELEPFIETTRSQHENILSAAKVRQDFTAKCISRVKNTINYHFRLCRTYGKWDGFGRTSIWFLDIIRIEIEKMYRT